MIERFEKISPHMIVLTSDLFKLAYDKYAIGAYNMGGVEEDVKVDEGSACLTDPEEAVEFVKQTKSGGALQKSSCLTLTL